MQLEDIPGYREDYAAAKVKAEGWQDLAWLGFPETVAGFPVRDLTLVDYTQMQWAGVPMVAGGIVTPFDLVNALWFLRVRKLLFPGARRLFNFRVGLRVFQPYKPRFRHYPRLLKRLLRHPLKARRFLARLKSISSLFRDARNITAFSAAKHQLNEYLERQFNDAPMSKGQSNGTAPARIHAPAAGIAAKAFRAVGMPAHVALTCPFPQLFQLMEAADESDRPKLQRQTTDVDMHYMRIFRKINKGEVTLEDVAQNPGIFRYRNAL